jgi:hypothetical protein
LWWTAGCQIRCGFSAPAQCPRDQL